MSKKHNITYEGFRRKNSLNLNQPSKNNTSIEVVHTKIKNEDLRLVEDLSMQLQNISKRSLTSRSFCQGSLQHTKSLNSINFYNEEGMQARSFNKQKPQGNALKKISFELEDVQLEFSQIKKQKVVNSLGFNQFDIIQETRSFCEEEMVQDISPVTLKHSLHEPLDHRSKLSQKPNIKVIATARTVIKKPAATKNEIANTKKEKLNFDFNELDKMQKQLQNKKVNRDNLGAKVLSNSTGLQRQKQVINVQGLKDSTKLKVLASKDHKAQVLKSQNQKSSKNLLPPPKIIESKPLGLSLPKTEVKLNEQQMVATRMLTEKQKLSLVNRLLNLREIIQKNEICSDSSNQIVFHLNSIQKLLTH